MTGTSRTKQLNDLFRKTFIGGRVLVTTGVRDRGEPFVSEAIEAVRRFEDFTSGNDPYDEHDFGSTVVEGQKVFWKIDYYGTDMTSGSPDPSNPNETTRVLTVMLAHEY